MKVLLCSYSGYGTYIDNLLKEQGATYVAGAIINEKVINHVEEKAYNIVKDPNYSEENIGELVRALIKKHPILKLSEGHYVAENKDKYTKWNTFVEIDIEEVDTSKMWTIEEYDGSNYVRYLSKVRGIRNLYE